MAEKKQSISTRMRMPYLNEVLSRRTRPPLDLWCFYVFLDRLGNGEQDLLDFWLDVHQHKALCRAYFKDLHRTGTAVEQEWPDFYNWARQHGSHYADVAGLQGEPQFSHNETQLREAEKREADRMLEDRDSGLGSNLSHRERRDTESHGPRPMTPTSPGYAHSTSIDNRMGQATGSPFSAYQQDQARNRGGEEGSDQGGARRVSAGPTVIRKNQVVTQMVLFTSAERIFARYLMDNAEKPVYFPAHLRVHDFPNPPRDQHACDPRIPDYFNAQQDYVYKELEQQYYPAFLREKGFGNLTRPGVYGSLIAGLFCLWAGFVVAFTLVFYDYKPKVRRLGLIVPFFFAFYFLFSAYWALAPHLVLLRRSEVGFFKTVKIRDNYILRLHAGRAAILMAFVIVCTAIMTVIWWAVPGHRL
ncbi:hypothetical protein HD553DRAFT_291108 [Filobasidium floriforme]|uniref:uncharacterized protein n=1 Tax=Filobasidium floriforme TaxID=5210 RepID=UPI001E8EDF32|nr:uncharacterized protein HD553DRAFT_291108 [Filobasidium floriforme]KAH8090743.1 hypothetical protein HD553DRAFT_291108 [Filobasidium floriforme]